MAQYTNFYQQINEANMRLKNTVILYDGDPYYVLCVTDHKADGIFRLYLDPLPSVDGERLEAAKNCVPCNDYDPKEDGDIGEAMDDYLSSTKSKILRKKINSPLFNKFRPFPLGMCQYNDHVLFTQRRPTRRIEQGLTSSMIHNELLKLGRKRPQTGSDIHPSDIWLTSKLHDVIKGVYPSPTDALKMVKSGDKESVAFDRNFAFCRGPAGTIFTAYRDDFIGLVAEGDLSVLKLSPEFEYTKELVTESGIFNNVRL